VDRIFYGWIVLAGLFLIYMASNGIVLNAIPTFYPSMIQEFGWSEAEVTQPAGLFFLASAAASLIGGVLVDKYPVKRLMIVGLLMVTAALGSVGLITNLSQFILIYLVFAMGLAIGGLIPSMVLLTRWFVQFRGIAVGILLMANNFGGSVFNFLIGGIIDDSGWRLTVFILAGIGGLMMLIPVLFVVKNRPEDVGAYPDGADAPPQNLAEASVANSAVGPTLKEALQSPVFYLLAFVTAVMWFCIIGLLQHQPIYFGQDLQLNAELLGGVIGIFFLFGFAGNILFGFLSDRFDKSTIMLVATVTLATGIALIRFASADATMVFYAYAMVAGLGYGGSFTMIQLTIADFFAGASYGKILGVFTFVDTLAGSMGAIVLGSMRVADGSYIQSFNIMLGLCVVSIIFVVILMQIRRSQRMQPA